MTDYAAARRNMVDTQLRTYDVNDRRVLDAIESVPREMFVPPALRALAYTDQTISVGEGRQARQLLQTMVLARLLQALDIAPGDRLLDVAGGTGYGAAVAASLGARVTAVEDDPALADLTRSTLRASGFDSIPVVAAELAVGDPAGAPYDVIVVHGSAESAPDGLLKLLADGGRLGVILGNGRAGRAVVFTRSGDSVGRRSIFDAAAQPLAAFAAAPAFQF